MIFFFFLLPRKPEENLKKKPNTVINYDSLERTKPSWLFNTTFFKSDKNEKLAGNTIFRPNVVNDCSKYVYWETYFWALVCHWWYATNTWRNVRRKTCNTNMKYTLNNKYYWALTLQLYGKICVISAHDLEKRFHEFCGDFLIIILGRMTTHLVNWTEVSKRRVEESAKIFRNKKFMGVVLWQIVGGSKREQVSGYSIFVKGEKEGENKGETEAVSTFDHVCLALRTWSISLSLSSFFLFLSPRPSRNFAHMPEHWRVESAPCPRANYRWPRVTTSGPLSSVTSLA